jgi:hypothetical protein
VGKVDAKYKDMEDTSARDHNPCTARVCLAACCTSPCTRLTNSQLVSKVTTDKLACLAIMTIGLSIMRSTMEYVKRCETEQLQSTGWQPLAR